MKRYKVRIIEIIEAKDEDYLIAELQDRGIEQGDCDWEEIK